MNVLLVGPDRTDPGGVANYYNSVFPRLTCDDISVRYLEIGSTHGKKSKLHFLNDQLRFRAALRKYNPDVVHLNPSLVLKSFIRDGIFMLLARMYDKKVLVFYRGWQVSFERYVSGVLRLLFKLTYQKADMSIVLASSFSKCLSNWGVVSPIKLGTTVVADEMLEKFDVESRVRDIANAEEVRILFLARLEKEKGVLDVVQAVIRQIDSGCNISLTIAGEGPVMGDIMEVVSKRPEYHKRIVLVGYVRGDDKIEIFKASHIFCFPSLYAEGMPNSIMEAMGFGMPIITCPVGGIADFFDGEKMGVLIQDRTVDAISDAIENITSDRQRLVEIARYNHEYAKKRFLASTNALILQDYYRELAATI